MANAKIEDSGAIRRRLLKEMKDGIYSFDDLRVVCQSVNELPRYVTERCEESVETIELDTNSMSMKIDVADNKILCLAVPYSDGWRAYVDGKETPILRANVWCMAVELEPGNHSIVFNYHTPWLSVGKYTSLISFLIFVVLEYGYLKKKWYVK